MLTDKAIRAAKPRQKPYKLFDGRGLYLLINPNGSRWWRFRYRYAGKEQLLSLGVYGDVSLEQARTAREKARLELLESVNPAARRRAQRVRSRLGQDTTFRVIAEELLGLQSKKLAHVTVGKARWMLESFVYPKIGSLPIADVSAADVLALLRPIEAAGNHETAHRTRAKCSQVFRYAIATSRAHRDPTHELRGALAPVSVTPRAAITDPTRIAELLRAIDSYSGFPPTMAALRLAPLVFARPGELRMAEWSEFDLDAAEWRIPAARMKMRAEHVIPLSTQALTIVRDLKPLTDRGRFLFPSVRSAARPMSNNTVNAALRRLGYTTDEMTGHGFRALASTRLNELGWSPDVIERQLAHAERNKVRAAYNRAQYLGERRQMMQAWSDHLDQLKAGGRIVPFRRARPGS